MAQGVGLTLPTGARDRPRAPKGASKVGEIAYQRQITDAAKLFGWTWNHNRRSLGGEKQGWVTATTLKGMPDLMLIRPPRLMFIEVKGHVGLLTPEQEIVLDLLDACDGVMAFATWPWEIAAVIELLR